jgi:hypothetical protein
MQTHEVTPQPAPGEGEAAFSLMAFSLETAPPTAWYSQKASFKYLDAFVPSAPITDVCLSNTFSYFLRWKCVGTGWKRPSESVNCTA